MYLLLFKIKTGFIEINRQDTNPDFNNRMDYHLKLEII